MHPKHLKQLVKESVLEILKENLTSPIIRKGSRVKDIYGNFGTVEATYVDGKHATVRWDNGTKSEVEISWITPMREASDPISQGPNPDCKENLSSPANNAHSKMIQRMKAYGELRQKVENGTATPEEIQKVNQERPWVRSILQQAGYGVQGGHYMREAFDPTSQGPNPDCKENPYPAWNNRMRALEEESSINEETIYKDRQGGTDVYWIDNKDSGGKIILKPESIGKYIKKGYIIVDLSDK